ncbi:regulator of RNase E activity RraA [Rhodococcus wratislaviensis]|uniref:Putative 4-hydroxy-4-methyl-2-oxoglutarate aldolase n=1 Tax=Rhodococcus wratislaviensis TaxID=44752 RepID=A0AB38FNY4_RHOWR|nr:MULTISPECIES: methyltransferase [Rhodococcus]REE72477.1 regulator of RNase E activity RraA [Rhodococcus wratislaviensis]WAM16321.1 methyltransferase [Rhodococcus sp. JS3073]SPZ42877.1 methyltransferase [Rhodococcus wratislaviensis]
MVQPDKLVAAFARIPTATIGDAQDRFGCPTGIRPMWPGATITGRAFTVCTRAGDNLYIHKALDLAAPGDILVVNGGGDETRALIGDLIGTRARAIGLGGFVIDGAVRDVAALEQMGMPVFARSTTPAGPYKHGPGRLGEPVAIGGTVVQASDIVIGDADGIAVVAARVADDVLNNARQIADNEIVKRTRYAMSGEDRQRPPSP